MENTQDANTTLKQTEKPLSFPFQLPDHSLTCPVEYEQLRQECPVAHVNMPFGGDAYLLTKHADIVKASTDARSDMIHASDGDVPRMQPGRVIGAEEGSLFSVSNERHNQIRRLVTKAFTVKHANEIRPRVVVLTNELIDAMERKGPPVDLLDDYAIQTPMTVICELLGVPRKDEELFRQWGHAIVSTTAFTQQERDDLRDRVIDYVRPIIAREREQPGDNVFGLLAQAYEQGEQLITEREMLLFASGLIGAGFETVSTTFTNMAFLVLQQPELLRQLAERIDDEAQLSLAIEELLRMTPLGNGGRPRITREEMTFSDTRVPAGEVLILAANSGNRDETVFPHANEINLDRSANSILTFGRGIHACLGQQLARMELQVLWTTLLKRLPTIRLAVPASEVPWRSGTATNGPAHLPVAW
jgi:cytochrome P450